MTKALRIFGCVAVAVTLATPSWAAKQAVARGSSSSGGGSSGGGAVSSGGSNSGGGSSAAPAPAPAPAAQSRSAPSGSRTGGTAQPRASASPSGPSRAGSAVPRSSTAPSNGSAVAVGRYRNGQPILGTAVPRPGGTYPIYPVYPVYPIYPGYWYPWFGPGFGYGFGFGYYDPWGYGSGGYGAYGYGYPGYGYGGYSGYGGGGGYTQDQANVEHGSIRLKANVSTAKVYIDGALMGTVDEFDGLSHHLDLPSGPHQLELRADGYQAYTTTIFVEANKTLTERVTLKKQ